MTYRIQGLGWLPDPPDHRDFDTTTETVQQNMISNVQALAQSSELDVLRTRGTKALSAPMSGAKLPKSVDLRSLCSPIEDQGNLGSCTAQAVSGLVEYLERGINGAYIDAARLFLYKVTRSYLGWTGDTGAFVRSTIKALRLFGVPPEDFYPYDVSKFDAEPSAFCYAFAGNYKAVQYYRLNGLDALKSSLASGIPFAFGFTCYQSIFSDEVKKSGNIPMPSAGEKTVGGHAVMAVGYDESAGRLLIRNSWGTGWGDAGYGTLPYEYVDKSLAQDFWALVKMDVVPVDHPQH